MDVRLFAADLCRSPPKTKHWFSPGLFITLGSFFVMVHGCYSDTCKQACLHDSNGTINKYIFITAVCLGAAAAQLVRQLS